MKAEIDHTDAARLRKLISAKLRRFGVELSEKPGGNILAEQAWAEALRWAGSHPAYIGYPDKVAYHYLASLCGVMLQRDVRPMDEAFIAAGVDPLRLPAVKAPTPTDEAKFPPKVKKAKAAPATLPGMDAEAEGVSDGPDAD